VTGGGPDLVFGGSGDDIIETFGPAVHGAVDKDIVAGDNARATLMLDEVRRVVTSDFDSPVTGTPAGISDDDVIITGNGEDLVFGGNGNDTVDTGIQGPFDNGDVTVLSLNFNSGELEGEITGVAGAVAVDNWNNLENPRPPDGRHDCPQPAPTADMLLFADGTPASGVAATWGVNLDSCCSKAASPESHSDINPDTQNERLFEGYVSSHVNQTLGVDMTGLSAHFTPSANGSYDGSYDVYVYLDSDTHSGEDDDHSRFYDHLVRRITDGTTTYYLNDASGNTFEGVFVEVSSTDALAPGAGNYVVFRGLTGDSLSIRINGGCNRHNRPVMSALQIVGGPGKDDVLIQNDNERDTVLGDNGIARLFNGQSYELISAPAVDAREAAGNFQADVIVAGDDRDIVVAGNDDDWVSGEAGDDLILGDNGRVVLFEGRIIELETGALTPDEDGDGRCEDGDDDDDFDPYGLFGVQLTDDNIGGADVLEGGKDDDLIYGQFGNDRFRFVGAGLGFDRLVEAGNANVQFNDLHDMLDFDEFMGEVDINLGRSSRQTVNAAIVDSTYNLHVTLFSSTAFEDVFGGGGNDVIDGNRRNNILVGGAGDDVIDGECGDDVLIGQEGDDNITGGSGDDLIDGGAGHDFLWAGWSHDHNDHDDTGDDNCDCGHWNDTNVVLGGSGDDVIRGSNGNDLLAGEAGDDKICALGGEDFLLGGEGQDKLCGGCGQDTIVDGTDDILLGLLEFYSTFAAQFEQDAFFYNDPNAGNPNPTTDLPARVWVEAYLEHVLALDNAPPAIGTDAPPDEPTVDTTAPMITVDTLLTNDPAPELTGTVNDPDAALQVTVAGTAYAAVNNVDGTWTLADDTINPALADGTYDVAARATDSAGNEGTDATTDELVVDTTAPVGTVDVLTTTDTTPALTGTVDDPNATIEVTVVGTTYATVNNSDGTWTLADDTISPALVEGTYDVVVSATDAAGNEGTDTTTDELVVDAVDDHGNSAALSTAVLVPSSTAGNLEVGTDADWFGFSALAGAGYTFETILGTLPDTRLTLFDTDGVTQIAFDDDGGEGLASKIEWTAPASGTYFLEVGPFSNTQTGTYSLIISSYSVQPGTLSLSIAQASISESGGVSEATVTRSPETSGPLTVTLASSDTTEATVPSTVTIDDGADSAIFTVTGVDDAVVDGPQTVTITASASGHTNGTDTVEVTDDDLNAAPSVALDNTLTLLPENTDTTHRIKVADIVVTDDGVGTNDLRLSGVDAALFEIDGTQLYLKAGTVLDSDTNPVLDVTVEVDDAAVGTDPDDMAALPITVTEPALGRLIVQSCWINRIRPGTDHIRVSGSFDMGSWAGGVVMLRLDTRRRKFILVARADLSGLIYPFAVEIAVGDYIGSDQVG